jgi:RNA polymerase sigma factor FliA
MDNYTADRDGLIERYQSYAHALASDFIGRVPPQVEKEDMLRYAELGLVEAATTFNPSAGVHFKTFAYYRIRGAVYDGLRELGGMPREFYRQLKFERAASAYLEDYSAQPANPPSSTGYAELKNISGSILNTYLLSLETVSTEPLAAASEAPDRCFQFAEMAQHVRNAVAQLPEKNRKVIEDYYFHDRTLEAIGKQLGLSKSWVCRLHAKGVEMLRSMLESSKTFAGLEATAMTVGQ